MCRRLRPDARIWPLLRRHACKSLEHSEHPENYAPKSELLEIDLSAQGLEFTDEVEDGGVLALEAETLHG